MKINRYIKRLFTLSLLLGNFLSVLAQRDTRTLNDGWRFYKGECSNAFSTDFKDNHWETVNLPHTWNADAYTIQNYYMGTGWYRRSLSLPSAWKDKQVFLKLDGASKFAEVYMNGKKIGEHAGGYTACMFDLTPFLSSGNANILAVCVDNKRKDIAPISGDFTYFGGMFRDAWLVAVPQRHFHFNEYGAEGVSVTTPQVSAEEGVIGVVAEIKNELLSRSSVRLVHTVYAPDGSLVQKLTRKVSLKGKELATVALQTAPIRTPELWTPETPNLYKVETELRDASTDEVLDRTAHHAAFRWFRFDGKEGFFLNGKPYKLRGICRHQDQAPVGSALSDEMHRRDFRMMKEMGANFIRIAHYPQDDALLELCDKEGMLAWEEIPIIDIVPEDVSVYGDNCERNLKEMIYQHRNHPSIILWGYMNEILLASQGKYDKEDELAPIAKRTLELANRLERALKETDPTRLSTIAFHGDNVYNKVGLGQITDVSGWNLYWGWYCGELSGFDEFLAYQQQHYPNRPVIVSEYGAGADRRLHSLEPKVFDFSCEYQQIYLEHYLPVLERTPYVCGGTLWNFIDFSSGWRGESMPHINNKGVVCNDRTPKDTYYYYQAMWREDIPVLHVASRDWKYRSGVQQGDEPVVQPVKVYTNLSEVELFVDGESLGTKTVENRAVVFQVPFRNRTHFLSAQGDYNGKSVRDGVEIYFTPVPDRLNDRNLYSLELAVNVGSNCSFTSEESQLTWLADRPYKAGGWGYIGGKPNVSQKEIQRTSDTPLYQMQREDIDGYRFDVPQGEYEIELLFTDIYRPTEQSQYLLGKDGNVSGQGINRFDILVNGEVLEAGFAPSQEGGYFGAVKRRYQVQNRQDALVLTFKSVQGTRFLSGIKLRKLF